MAHSGVLYVKKIPVMCTMGGSKDFTISQYTAELSSVKVVTLTLGHPVVMRGTSPRGVPDGTSDDGRRPDHGRGPHHRAGAVVGVVPPRLRRAP